MGTNRGRNGTVSRRTFLGVCLAATGATPFAGVRAEQTERPDRARLVVEHPRHVRILQFTDLHYFSGDPPFSGLSNRPTTALMTKLVHETKPDLVMATGDLWCNNRDGKGEEFMRFVIAQFESLGVPWAFAWGNHDELPDFSVGHEALANAKNSLYRGADADGNYVIDIVDKKQRCLWQLLCLNSGVDGLGSAARAWLKAFEASGEPDVPRIAFFHIPVKQYADIWTSGVASGILDETPCIEKEDGSTLPLLKACGVRACFCGHDHVNDYSGLSDGVELVYGRATGLGGYGTKLFRKGGKLIALNCHAKRYEWISVTPDGGKWHPKPGERIEGNDRQ